MKKVYFILIGLLSQQGLNAQILVDNFSTAGNLNGYNSWANHSGTVNQIQITGSSALTYTDYPNSGVGGSILINSTNTEDCNRVITNQTSGTVYASFLLKGTTGTTGSGAYFFHFGPNPWTTSNWIARVWARVNSGNLQFQITDGSTAGTYLSTNYALNTVHLIVVKFNIISGSTSLFINPNLSGSEPAADQTISGTANNVGGIAFREASNLPELTISNVRVATSWDQAPLPVRLTSFNALVRNNLVNLKWTTATEIQNYGFEIERAQVTTTSPRNLRYAKIGFVRGSGTSNSPKEYSFIDNSRLYGVYSYRLKQVDIDGGYEYSDAVTVRVGTRPIVFDVKNYPNPFNPETNIRYELPNSGNVNLSIYNLLGEKVATLVDEYKEEGIYQEAFDARDLPSGVYFSILQTEGIKVTRKILLIK